MICAVMLGILLQKICKEVILVKKLFVFLVVFTLVLCSFTVMPKAQTNVYEYYKSQLNADEQEVYKAFIKAAKSSSGTCNVPTLSTVQYSFTSSTNITSSTQITEFTNSDPICKAAVSKLNIYFKNAIHAVIMDHPELYWLDNSQLGTINHAYQASGKTVSITNVYVEIPGSVRQANAEQSINAVNSKLKSIGATGTDIEKVKKIHDWLCNNVKYVDGTHAHDLYGSLFNGKAVCQGYAEAFKAACDYYGIKCVCVEGDALNSQGAREAHMWNYVLINNTWYAIDVTWDDQEDRILYDYFLAGKKTVATHFDDSKFTDSHFPNGKFGGAEQKEFNYPVLSENGYSINNPTQKPTQKPVQNTATAKPTAKPTDNVNVTDAPQNTRAPENTQTTNTGENQSPDNNLTPTPTNISDSVLPTETPKNEQNIQTDRENSSLVIILACSGIGLVVVASIIVMIIRKKR